MVEDYNQFIKENEERALDVAEEKKTHLREQKEKEENQGKVLPKTEHEIEGSKEMKGYDFSKRCPHKLDFQAIK